MFWYIEWGMVVSCFSVEKALSLHAHFLGLIGLACAALSNVVEDAKAPWGPILWEAFIGCVLTLRKHRVTSFHESAHEGWGDLFVDQDVPDLEGWLRNQVLFFAWEAVLRCVSVLFRGDSEQAISDFAWRDLSAHLLVVSLSNVFIQTVHHFIDVHRVIKAGSLRNRGSLLRVIAHATLIRVIAMRVCVSCKRWLACWRMVGTDTAVEEDWLWDEGHLLNISVEQEVQVTLNQAFLWAKATCRAVTHFFHIMCLQDLVGTKLAKRSVNGFCFSSWNLSGFLHRGERRSRNFCLLCCLHFAWSIRHGRLRWGIKQSYFLVTFSRAL